MNYGADNSPKLLIVIIIIIVFRKIEWFRFHGQRDAHNSG